MWLRKKIKKKEKHQVPKQGYFDFETKWYVRLTGHSWVEEEIFIF